MVERRDHPNHAVTTHAEYVYVVKKDDSGGVERVARVAEQRSDEDVRTAGLLDHAGTQVVVAGSKQRGALTQVACPKVEPTVENKPSGFSSGVRIDEWYSLHNDFSLRQGGSAVLRDVIAQLARSAQFGNGVGNGVGNGAGYGAVIAELLGGLPDVLEELLDAMDDLVFFAKDTESRYRLVNHTLVRRVGRASKEELIGCRADEVFPAPFGEAFRAQDELVLNSGRSIRDRLELHFYPGSATGWCRTFKFPWRSGSSVVGLMGFSKDLQRPASDRAPAGVAKAMGFLERRLDQPLRVADLAAVAGMAPRSFERAIQDLFGASAGDVILQARIDRACRLLRDTDLPVAHIAQECGYGEHSSFSRQFRARVGLSPSGFRRARPAGLRSG
jgi:AraC-like DNA-binding protein